MKNQGNSNKWPDFRLNLEEIAGSVGNYGMVFPIVLGVAIVADVNLGHILLFFSIWYIITGIWFKMPIPVEPMKAIGTLVIAGNISGGEIAASGIIMGVVLLALGFSKALKFVQGKVPKSVLRGIQLGIALILLETSLYFVIADYILAIICITIVILFLLANKFINVPNVSALIVLLVGIVVGFATYGIPQISITSLPGIIVPTIQDFGRAAYFLAFPQLPMTVVNAILAISLISQDLLTRNLDPDKLAKSMGLMCLTSAPFGGIPMCHGSGGLIAHYRFGARTGAACIIAGLTLLPIALFFASPEFVEIIPVGVFGALLVFIGIELGQVGLKTDSYIVTGTIAILALITNVAIAFIIGMVLAYVLTRIRRRPQGD